MEAVLSVFYGALLGTVFSNYDKGWWWLIAGFSASLIYLPLLIVKVRSQWILPDQIFEHLDAKLELHTIKQELARKEAIDGFIDQAIKTLNSATCWISNNKDKALCDSAVRDGLAEVLNPLINRTQIVLDCNTAKFSVGARVFHFAQIGSTPLICEDEWLIFRDDIGISQSIVGDPGNNPDAMGAELQFRQAIETVTNENRMVTAAIEIGSQNFQLICSPIPVVCNEESVNGVLWICQECLQRPPVDLNKILLIFGRITANWLSKYHDCLVNREKARANAARLAGVDCPGVEAGDAVTLPQIAEEPHSKTVPNP